MIRVFIVDDHQLVIDGICLMLEAAGDILCVGRASNGREALDALELTPTDVLLLDINMPVMDGLECTARVRERFPDTRILALSMMQEASMVGAMMRRGAAGYLLKNAGKEEVIEAIRAVFEGREAFSPETLALRHQPVSQKAAKPISHPVPRISRREKQILQLIVEEFTTAEIAGKLFISFGTVETHRRNLLLKLNARNTAGLVKAALEFDLLK